MLAGLTAYEAIRRPINSSAPASLVVLIVASVGIVVNLDQLRHRPRAWIGLAACRRSC
jgi:Co/Zn/Cd efflux system component